MLQIKDSMCVIIKDTTSYNILIAEDNSGDSTIVEELLLEQISSPIIKRAGSYKETETIATTAFHFDVVLLDLTLPDISGEALIKAILKLITHTPIIVLTGFADIDFSIKSISLDIADYLLKDELSACILYKSIIYTIERKK